MAKKNKRKTDMVNHPSHYTSGKIEVIDFIEDQKLGFHEGNVVKYVSRTGKKLDRLEDLMKAHWYLERAIEKHMTEARREMWRARRKKSKMGKRGPKPKTVKTLDNPPGQ